MNYTPRYAQPFTLHEAVGLDVSTISEEIARLQLSLEHLQRTQKELQEYLESGIDSDVKQAIEENTVVIGSQEERIAILTAALSQKGVYTGPGSHHEVKPQSHSAIADTNASNQDRTPHEVDAAHDDGVFL